MKTAEVLERLEPIMHTQVRNVDHNPRTKVVVTPEMVTFRPGGGARILEMNEGGVQSLAKFVGLPANVAGKLQPKTFGSVATELLSAKMRYMLMVKDGIVTGITKRGEFHYLNPERALQSIERAIPGMEFHRVLIMENTIASLEVIGDKRQPVAKGDLIQGGAQITFSPIGTIDPLVQSYVLRLVCTNGMTSNTVLREYHYGGSGGGSRDGDSGGHAGSDNIWQWLRRSTRDAYNALDGVVNRYRQMIEEQIPPSDRALILEAMLKEAKIGGKVAEAVRAMAIERPPENSYQMMNLISFATSHIVEEPHRVRQGQLAVANYSHEETHARLCPLCHASRN